MKKISITSGSNGYPANLRAGWVGFDNFAQAEQFAGEIGGQVVYLRRRDGWQFYEERGRAFEAYTLDPTDVYSGDEQAEFITAAEAQEWAEEMAAEAQSLADSDDWTAEELAGILQKIAATTCQLEAIPPGQKALIIGGEIAEIYDVEALRYRFDVWENVIGVSAE